MATEYKPCEVELEFADGDYLFKLPLKRLAELEDKCGAGIGAIYKRLALHEYSNTDIREIVRLGLIGGGLTGLEAAKLIERYVDDVMPRDALYDLAKAVFAACMHGYSPPEDQKKPAGKRKAAKETPGSTSRRQSAMEPSSD